MSCAIFKREYKRENERIFPFSRCHLNTEYEFLVPVYPQSNDIVESFNESYGMYFQSTTNRKKGKPTNEITFHGKICICTPKCMCIFPLYVYQTPEVEMMMIHREKWFRLENITTTTTTKRKMKMKKTYPNIGVKYFFLLNWISIFFFFSISVFVLCS